ncbi:MAG: YceI family protein [Flavobacteriia bacterium]|nr:YceI family protein [Flavobacteriia bacterium]
MKRMFYPLVAGMLLMSSAYVSITSQDWKISENHSIEFISKDPTGIFKDFKGTIKYDEKDLAGSKFDVSIDVSSISTGNGMMNKKAQTEEWFNSEKFPEIKYTSSKIEKSETGITLYGDLKIKGTSKPTKIKVAVKNSGDKATFSGTFNVNRIDFHVGHKSETVPDVMKIVFEIPVTKK